MEIPFQKLQGLGNDFIIFFEEDVKDLNHHELAQSVCHRNFGIGADGMMILRNSNPLEMLFYNQDGSMAPMCGNGLRCFARYAYEQGFAVDRQFMVATKGGLMNVRLDNQNEFLVEVDLGRPRFGTGDIPSSYEKNELINETIRVRNQSLQLSAVFIGTSHSVVFVEDFGRIRIEELGPAIETHPLFPEKINVNFCKVISEQEIEVVTWERGAGKTLACGTGACASVVIANKLGYTKEAVKVNLPGGSLFAQIKEEQVYMKADAAIIAKGFYYYKGGS